MSYPVGNRCDRRRCDDRDVAWQSLQGASRVTAEADELVAAYRPGPAATVVLALWCAVSIGLVLPVTPLARPVHMTPLPAAYALWPAG